jgi:uncharacterized protein
VRPAILERLFPDQRRFYAAFATLATRVAEAARLLEQTLDDPMRQAELSARIQDVDRDTDAEEEGDLVSMGAVSDLSAGSPDPLDVLRWKTVYDQLEDALDECDDVANELETISVKHA